MSLECLQTAHRSEFQPLDGPLGHIGGLGLTQQVPDLQGKAMAAPLRWGSALAHTPMSGLPGLRNGLYRLPYRGFKGRTMRCKGLKPLFF